MVDTLPKNECCGCSACLQVCPKECITFVEDREGFLYPEIKTDSCIQCKLCEKVCPAINKLNSKQSNRVYAAINDDFEKRENSSSGGVFIQLAENTIQNGGVVFGAKWDNEWKVVHDYTQDLKGLARFQGSKYCQSIIGYSFKEAERLLKSNKKVLFSGTPCQIAGLKGYLRREYEHLYTAECVCHGVPSPGLWRKYLDETTKTRRIESINHRQKNTGWRNYSVVIRFSDGSEDNSVHDDNLWTRAFIKNLSLRPSCYRCAYKCVNSRADITLGDFWGIEKLSPQSNYDKGVSLIVTHNQKGKELTEGIHTIDEFSLEDIASYNGALFLSASENPKRAEFFDRVQSDSFTQTVRHLTKEPLTLRIKRLLRRFL